MSEQDDKVQAEILQKIRESQETRKTRLQRLIEAMTEKLPELKKLYEDTGSHWTYEDGIYRYYHGSFKVFYLQGPTKRIVQALQELLPEQTMNGMFMEIINDGLSKKFDMKTTNANWSKETRPIVEAFLHARFFLQMAIQYRETLSDEELQHGMLDSGWAAFLYLYGLR